MIYLDHNATTPCDERVLHEMLPYFSESFWNANSSHILGRRAAQVLESTRARSAASLGVAEEDLVFTSGATEGIHIALERLPRALLHETEVLASPVEHRAVQNALSRLKRQGVSVNVLDSKEGGRVEASSITRRAVYVVQAANSETGVVQPLAEIGEAVRKTGGLLICDAAQALWKMSLDQVIPHVDIAILSGHKGYGPKGVGVLVANREYRRMLRREYPESAQEDGLREGTINLPNVVGFGAACEYALLEGLTWRRNAQLARDEFEAQIERLSKGLLSPHFTDLPRLPNTSSVRVFGRPGDLFVSMCLSLATSYGSACSSGAFEPSPVLLASGLTRQEASETVRVSFGRDQDEAVARTCASELWKFAQSASATAS